MKTAVTVEAAQRATLYKLVVFTVSLAVVPITSYFASLRYLWTGNATYAALTAVFSANLVLAGYIMTAIAEDKNSRTEGDKVEPDESKKDQ